MRGANPRTPTGYDSEAMFHQNTHAKLNGPENQLRDSSTVKVDRTSRGIFLHAKPTKGGGATIRVTVCDPSTGTEKQYDLIGTEVTT